MFGEINFHLNWVYAFNNDLRCLFQNLTPADQVDPKKKKVGVLLDASGSMRDLQNEVKLMLSALKCMTGTIGMFNAPTPEHGTKIIDSVDELWGDDKLEGLDQLIVITDGYDTSSTAERILKCIVDGNPEYTTLPTMPATNKFTQWLEHHRDGEHASVVVLSEYNTLPQSERDALVQEFHAWHKAALDLRGAAVAAHLDALGIDMTIVGVGTEVKGFVAECAKPGRGLRTAYIDRGAEAEAVGSIISTVAKRKPRKRTSTESDETVVASTATAITEREVTAVRTEAIRTSTAAERMKNPDLLIDGPAFDFNEQNRYVEHIVLSELHKEHPDASEEDMKRMSRIVLSTLDLFRFLIHKTGGAPLSSSIFGSPSWPSGNKLPSGEADGTRKCALLEVPEAFGDLKPHRWTHMISRLVELLARNPTAIESRLKTPFTEELKTAIAANRVGPMFRHAGKPASYVAISHDLLQHEDLRTRTLYFKFKADVYDHFILHHRDALPFLNSEYGRFLVNTECRMAQAGNSSAKSYGGPAVPPPEAPTPPAAPHTAAAAAAASEEATDANDVGDPDAPPPSTEGSSATPQQQQPERKHGRPGRPRLPQPEGKWGCSRCRWRARGCKAKRCNPHPDFVKPASQESGNALDSPASQGSAVSEKREAEEPAESTTSDAEGSTDSVDHAAACNAHAREVKTLKRRICELEKDNKELEKDNGELLVKLQRIKNLVGATD